MIKSNLITILIMLLSTAAIASEYESSNCANFHPLDWAYRPVTNFPVFDSLVRAEKVGHHYGYINIPDSDELGLHTLTFVPQTKELFDQAAINQLVLEASKKDKSPVLFFDIEDKRFPYDIRHASKEAVDKTIDYFGSIADWVHAANPNARLGFYGAPVVGDERTLVSYYLACLKQSNPHWRDNPHSLIRLERDTFTRIKHAYEELVAANDYMMPLAEKIDIIFPAFYTWRDNFVSNPLGEAGPFVWNNDAGWRELMLLVLENARRFGKPVYSFVWAQFHNMLPPPKGGSEIPLEYWRKQLSFVRQHADGAVLFGVGKAAPGGEWQKFKPWWNAVVNGLLRSEADKKSPSSPHGLKLKVVTPSDVDFTQVVLEWVPANDNENGSGVEGYRIYRDGVLIADTTALSFRDTGLDAGSTHVYFLTAYDYGRNESLPSRNERIEVR